MEMLNAAGDIIIDSIVITSSNGNQLDISRLVVNLEIYEDLFSPIISGNMSIIDSLNLTENMPFIGEELITIKAHTPRFTGKNNIIDYTFLVYKLTDRTITSDSSVAYILHFCSTEMYADANIALSRTYSGKISDTANKLLNIEGLATTKTANIETTINNHTHTSNYWSPFRNLNFLARRAINKDSASNYLFFENKFGFQFVAMSSLFQQPVFQTYFYDNYYQDIVALKGTIKDFDKEYARIRKFDVSTVFDYIERSTSGLYNAKLISHDLVTKKYSVKTLSYVEQFPKTFHLNKFPITTEKVISLDNSDIFVNHKHHSLYNGFGDNLSSRWMLERNNLIAQLSAFKISITVAGKTNMTVGQIIDVVVYKNQPIEKTDVNVKDKYFSGKYIISAINHEIGNNQHFMHMECIKESSLINFET
jgi:hypothetical protein